MSKCCLKIVLKHWVCVVSEPLEKTKLALVIEACNLVSDRVGVEDLSLRYIEAVKL